MQTFGWFKAVAVSLLFTQWMGTAANAAQCGTSAAGFEYWKQQFAEEARGRIGGAAIAALMSTQYAPATISADRGQRKLSSVAGSIPRQTRRRGDRGTGALAEAIARGPLG